ncbi:hypothetical protein HK405_001851, partial [Cladochytrium tenue]
MPVLPRTILIAMSATVAAVSAGNVALAALSPWAPRLGTSWQWQLSQQPYNYTMHVDAIDLDLDGLGDAAAGPAHAAGMKAICYIN